MHSKKAKEAAQTLHERFGAHLSWPARFMIAMAIDGLDLLLDFVLGFGAALWIPLALPTIHAATAAAQVAVSMFLFGRVWGIIQLAEFYPPLAALPLLTPTCIAAYLAERYRAAESEQERGESMFTGIVFLGGLFVGFLFWTQGFIGLFSIFGMGLVGIAMRWALPAARMLPFSWIGTVITSGILLLVVGGIHLTLVLVSNPEGFRDDAWKALMSEGDYRVISANKADKLGTALDVSGLMETAGKVIHEGRSTVANMITGTGQKQDPKKPIIIDRKNQPKFGTAPNLSSPTLPKQALNFIAENVIKPAEVTTLTGDEAKKLTPEIQEVMSRLKIGKFAAKMYMFDFVLERAVQIRKDKVASLEKWRLWLGLVFVFLASVAVAQLVQENRDVDEEPEVLL